jgi:predicted phage terminase large subunit-like protein
MSKQIDKLNAILRTDFHAFFRKVFETIHPNTTFHDNWHIQLLCWRLSQCASGDTKRLIINLPPRSGKSLLTSVALPAWLLGHDPTNRLLCVSHTDNLAGSFSRDCRRVMETQWYKKLFPLTRLDKQKNTESEYATTKNGFRLATSVGGPLTGRGGDFIIIDDPIKTGDVASEAERTRVNDWYSNTLYSRLDNKNDGIIIIVMQRTHIDDLTGYVENKDDWAIVRLRAIAEESETLQIGEGKVYARKKGEALHPEREDISSLEKTKNIVGSFNFSSQYQQAPLPPEGNILKAVWFRFYYERMGLMKFDRIIQSWDPAVSTGDGASYSVCTTWGQIGNRYYLLHVKRERFDFPALLHFVQRHAREWGAEAVLIENASSGRQLLEILAAATDVPVVPVKVDTDKIARVARVSAIIEAGRVYLPKYEDFTDEFLEEVLPFPQSKHDDQVDSMTQFLYWIQGQEYRRKNIVTVRPLGTSSSGIIDHYHNRTGIPIWAAHVRRW